MSLLIKSPQGGALSRRTIDRDGLPLLQKPDVSGSVKKRGNRTEDMAFTAAVSK